MTAAELKHFPLLAEFSDEDREVLFELLEPRSIRKGRSIYRETGEAEGLVLIAEGEVRLSTQRREVELGVVGAGQILGAASLLTLGSREATAKAETACEILLLERTAYRRLLDDYPRTACRLTEAIARSLAGLLREGLEPPSE